MELLVPAVPVLIFSRLISIIIRVFQDVFSIALSWIKGEPQKDPMQVDISTTASGL